TRALPMDPTSLRCCEMLRFASSPDRRLPSLVHPERVKARARNCCCAFGTLPVEESCWKETTFGSLLSTTYAQRLLSYRRRPIFSTLRFGKTCGWPTRRPPTK